MKITPDCGVFIPVSIGEKNYKNQPTNARVIVKDKMALFPGTVQ